MRSPAPAPAPAPEFAPKVAQPTVTISHTCASVVTSEQEQGNEMEEKEQDEDGCEWKILTDAGLRQHSISFTLGIPVSVRNGGQPLPSSPK